MLVTNNTPSDYWFGPLRLPANGTLTVDDTSETSLYLTDDVVADAINNLSNAGKITCTSTASPFPRPTGVPQLLHGDGDPNGLVFAPQGSLYMRRDGAGPNNLYTKTTGTTINIGWVLFTTGSAGTSYRKTTSKAVTNTVTETDLLNGEIQLPANSLGATGLMRLTAWGDALYNSGANQPLPRFKFKVGSGPTTILDTSTPAQNCPSSSASRFGWRITVEWMNLSATNSQWATMTCELTMLGSGASTTNIGFATGEGTYSYISGSNATAIALGSASSAIDTTVGLPIILSVINGSATSTEVKLFGAIVEIV